MAVPIIALIAAGVAGAYGAKKGYDAYQDNSEANDYNNKSQEDFNRSQEKLNANREATNRKLASFGAIKIELYDIFFPRFIESFEKIKNVDFKHDLKFDLWNEGDFYSGILEIKEQSIKMHELAGGTLSSLGAGALAGLGAYGGAGMLATASTGTAISSLSGVAATNATLAWFGGGALSAGGMGIAGGTAVLGGVVAGPVLAVAGGLLAMKAEKAKNEAHANYYKAKALVNEMETANVIVNSIYSRVSEVAKVTDRIKTLFVDELLKMEYLVSREVDYKKYIDKDQELIARTASMALTLKEVCDTSILKKDGSLDEISKDVLNKASDFLKEIEAI